MKTEECIALEDRIAVEIERIGGLGRVSILCVLNCVVCYPKDVLDECQIAPPMVQHRLQVVVAIKQNQEASLGRLHQVAIRGCWLGLAHCTMLLEQV